MLLAVDVDVVNVVVDDDDFALHVNNDDAMHVIVIV